MKSVLGFHVRLGNPDLHFENLNPDFPIERTLSMSHRICLTVAVVTFNDMIIECSPIFGQGTQCIHLPIRSRKLKITENSASQPLLAIVLAHKYNSLSRLFKTYLRSCNEYKGQGKS